MEKQAEKYYFCKKIAKNLHISNIFCNFAVDKMCIAHNKTQNTIIQTYEKTISFGCSDCYGNPDVM